MPLALESALLGLGYSATLAWVGSALVGSFGVVLATDLVVYLSFNAFTHPVTLRLQLTHLWPWPSEGTVRVIGLAICLVAVALARFLRAGAGTAGQAR